MVVEKIPIVGSCVTTIRYAFFLCLVSWVGEMLGWNLKWMCMDNEVVRTEWEMMGMDGHKRLFRKWKCLMLSGSS